jgi:hypothetical protein
MSNNDFEDDFKIAWLFLPPNEEKRTKERKIYGRERKRVHYLERVFNSQAATEYQQHALAVFEKKNNKPVWHVLKERVLVSEIQDKLQEHPFTKCIWLVHGFIPSAKLNVKKKKGERNKDRDPYFTGRWPETLWPSVIPQGYCGATYFKGCGAPQCENQELPCTAMLKICYRYESLGGLCDFLIWGAHSKAYYPSDVNLRPTTKLKNETKKALELGVPPSVIYNQHITDMTKSGSIGTKNSSKYIPPPIASAMNRNEIVRNNGHASTSFTSAIKFLKNEMIELYPDFRVIETINEKHITDMTPQDYTFIIYNIKVLKENQDTILSKVNLDSCFKLTDDNEYYGNTPTTIITLLNKNRHTQTAFVILTHKHNSDVLIDALDSIQMLLKQLFNIQTWDPVFMIDDGSTEKSALNFIGHDFVICKFHLIRAWTKHLNGLSKEQKKRHLEMLYKLYNSRNDRQYEDNLKELKEKGDEDFIKYFEKTWNTRNFYKAWTCINRQCSFGDWVTNNCCEATFKKIQHKIGIHYRKFNIFVKKLIECLNAEQFSTNLLEFKPTPKTFQEANKRFKKGKELLTNEITKIEQDSIEQFKFIVQSEKNSNKTYTCNLHDLECTCYDFMYNYKPCKHLYAAMIKYMKINNVILPGKTNCFHYISAIFLHIHHPQVFKDWNLEVMTAYPITYETKGRRRLNKTIKKMEKLTKEDEPEEESEEEYDISGVEGARFSPVNGKSEILVVWKDYYDNDGDLIASWADYDSSSNKHFTDNFFRALFSFLERKKSTSEQDFTCIERTQDHDHPYVFSFLGQNLNQLPSLKKTKEFFSRFQQNYYRGSIDLLSQSIQTTTTSLSQQTRKMDRNIEKNKRAKIANNNNNNDQKQKTARLTDVTTKLKT